MNRPTSFLEPIELATMHAPGGGITIAGEFFGGGEFIPNSTLAKASPEQKAALVKKGLLAKASEFIGRHTGLPMPKQDLSRQENTPIEDEPLSDSDKSLLHDLGQSGGDWPDGLGEVGDEDVRLARHYPPDNEMPRSFFGWTKKLGDPQKSALREYTGKGDILVNALLRGDKVTNPEAKHNLRRMQEAFEQAPDLEKPATVWRGLSTDNDQMEGLMKSFQDAHSTKSAVEIKGFLSCTLSPPIASKYGAGQHGVVMEISTKKGIYLDSFSKYPSEREFLMNHASKFRVSGIKKVRIQAKGGIKEHTVIQLEHVNG